MLELKITDAVLKNIFLFLDRVELKGHDERRAMNQIEQALASAQENSDETSKE